MEGKGKERKERKEGKGRNIWQRKGVKKDIKEGK